MRLRPRDINMAFVTCSDIKAIQASKIRAIS